jgi:hypothetical protein
MIIIGIILGFVGLAYLCWLLFTLAVYALPLFAAVAAGLATYHSGSGPIGAIILGAIAGSITLVAGQIAFTTLRSPLTRAAIALLFALPLLSLDIMPHSASRTLVYPPKVGDRQ